MNKEQLEKSVKDILKSIGEDPTREGLLDTPKRVAKAYEEFFDGYKKDPKKLVTTFEADGYDEMIILKDIDFLSFCEHHMLPFSGKVHVGYFPKKRIIGLSKIGRLVDIYAHRLQVQERMTQQIGETLFKILKPFGVGVIVEAKHLCISSRGASKPGATVTTSALFGAFKNSEKSRTEFLKLIGKQGV